MQEPSSVPMILTLVSILVTAFTALCAALFPFLTELVRLRAARLAKQQELLETTVLSCLSDFSESFSRLRSHAGEDALHRFAAACYRIYGFLPGEASRTCLDGLLRSLYGGSFDFESASSAVSQVSSAVAALITPSVKKHRSRRN